MLEFRIIHDGAHWIAERGDLVARGRTIEDLDSALAGCIKERMNLGDAATVDVRMTFDNTVIPEWIRQYSNHYFNRVVTLSL